MPGPGRWLRMAEGLLCFFPQCILSRVTHLLSLPSPCLFLLVVGVVLGFELKAYTLSHSTSPFFFVKDFLKIGSHELFA
jgi:hypothetical protein